MIGLFYLIGVFYFLLEMFLLSFNKNDHNKYYGSNSSTEFSFIMISYIIWLAIGLFSSNGILFLIVFLYRTFSNHKNFYRTKALTVICTLAMYLAINNHYSHKLGDLNILTILEHLYKNILT